MSILDQNIEKARNYMQPLVEAGVLNHIDGQTVPAHSGALMDTISPVDGTKLADVAKSDAADIDAAVAAAKAAFRGWSQTPGAERRNILIKVAEAIEARAEEIAFTECMDTGQALRFMSKAAIRGAANFRFFADQAPGAEDGEVSRTPTQMNTTSRRPVGPVGVITPWNTPFMLSTWKIAPALAAGCTVVHKPAEFSPMTAKLLVEIAESAGLPPGVLNVVNGLGETAGKRLTEHPDIKAIAFVGESRTGSMIMKQGAETLKRVHFELGGKNPVIIFDDADIDRAVDAAVFMIYSLNGERCTSSSRLLVQSSIYDEVCARVADAAKRIKVGHPLDPDTVVGPLIHPVHEEKVLSYFVKAKDQGATIAAGGEKVGDQGNFVAPTLFTNATNDMSIAQEEIFGPVLTAISFDTEDDALAMANDTQYGLAAYLWTNDLNRAIRMTDQLQAGMMWVNSENIRHLPSPFGGVKASGIGRDGGDWSFDFYMETVNVSFPRAEHRIPKLGG
ncbi:5-carboxymethyl-2-hydroxymuconic-semialdehyde dehydrogenase [Sagittula marina]|uniref:5-carboxymethyl-2-hydroxymuconic-semialdehyde dehydrogenase n=1 Tax=Sagittula marina TaxID=943940 RepID=A0A7W6GTZ9_9RHOB|nr:5-carboxymethyl-2-hydroxymuconate semialdehyde dehydrogenase [Sagittula marina]MBB3988081.1 5-carboxymethyl-2-hydroxymuconic-semialdehyde dehydrogenase [Sagittula marina]